MQAVHVQINTAQRAAAVHRVVVHLALVGVAVFQADVQVRLRDAQQLVPDGKIFVHREHDEGGYDAGHRTKHHAVQNINWERLFTLEQKAGQDENTIEKNDIQDMLDGPHDKEQRHCQQERNKAHRRSIGRRMDAQIDAQHIEQSLKGVHQPGQQQAVFSRECPVDRLQAHAHGQRYHIGRHIGPQKFQSPRQYP